VRVGQQAALPAPIVRALEKVRAELTANRFAAPATERLTQLGLGPRELGAAVRAGALVRIADGVVLLPGSIQDAATMLGALPQPFTVSQARQALGTTRRVTVPLLEILDRKGLTLRLPDDRRRMRR
jgi:selenocysteine-specific elongation factor